MDIVNKFFSNKTPSQILFKYNTFLLFCYFYPKLRKFIKQIDFSQNIKYSLILYLSKYMPHLKNKVDSEINSFSQKIKNDLDQALSQL